MTVVAARSALHGLFVFTGVTQNEKNTFIYDASAVLIYLQENKRKKSNNNNNNNNNNNQHNLNSTRVIAHKVFVCKI